MTILNPKANHHHVSQFEQAGANKQLSTIDRQERLKEYHRQTAERRKIINAKAQARREKLQKELDAQEA